MPDAPMLSDQEFMQRFRAIVQRYIASIDEWERVYQRRYTLPKRQSETLTWPAMNDANLEYVHAREALVHALPRAEAIAFRFGLRAPWRGLLAVPLGEKRAVAAGQSLLGRSERLSAMDSITKAIAYSAESQWGPLSLPAYDSDGQQSPWQSLLSRLRSLFF